MDPMSRFHPSGAPVAVLTTQPLDRALDYRAPEGGVEDGAYVEVPLGPRKVLGVVWGPGTGDWPVEKLRPILRILPIPAMTPALRDFTERAAAYTLTPLPAMLRLGLRAPGLGEAPGKAAGLRSGHGRAGPRDGPARPGDRGARRIGPATSSRCRSWPTWPASRRA